MVPCNLVFCFILRIVQLAFTNINRNSSGVAHSTQSCGPMLFFTHNDKLVDLNPNCLATRQALLCVFDIKGS